MEWFDHPLLILIIGLIFSAGFIPIITKKWQNRQSELMIKQDLFNKSSEWGGNFYYFLTVADELKTDLNNPKKLDRYMESQKEFSKESVVITNLFKLYFGIKHPLTLDAAKLLLFGMMSSLFIVYPKDFEVKFSNIKKQIVDEHVIKNLKLVEELTDIPVNIDSNDPTELSAIFSTKLNILQLELKKQKIKI